MESRRGILLLLGANLLAAVATADIGPPSVEGSNRYSLARGYLFSRGRVLGVEPGTPRPGFGDTVRIAIFMQSGGRHVVDGELALRGYLRLCYSCSGQSYNATYRLSGGTVTSERLTINVGVFKQLGGTNRVTGDLVASAGWHDSSPPYELHRGRLITSNTFVHLGYTSPMSFRGFRQSGGVCVVRNLLALEGNRGAYPVGFDMTGGKLMVRDIALSGGAIFRQSGGTIAHSGKLTLSAGHWLAGAGSQELGPLAVKAATTNSSISFPWSSTTGLRFAAGGSVTWEPDAMLVVHNWRGATNGVVVHRLFFGTNSKGLTPEQLRQIRFRDPALLPRGDYAAQIRANGEIVPGMPIE